MTQPSINDLLAFKDLLEKVKHKVDNNTKLYGIMELVQFMESLTDEDLQKLFQLLAMFAMLAKSQNEKTNLPQQQI